MKKLLSKIVLALAVLTAGAALYADELQDVRKSMAARLKDVVELKRDGKVGENNLGYLAARVTGDRDVDAMVKAENADRKIVYDAIAKKNGSITSKQVGQARAKEIVKKAKPGEWLQSANGAWYKKGDANDPDAKK